MTLQQIKQYNDANIRQQLDADSVSQTTVADALDNLADYLAVAPGVSLTLNKPAHEAGDNSNVTLNWNVAKTDNPITAITVAGNNIPIVDGNSQIGTQFAGLNPNADSTFTLTATDGIKPATVTATSYLRKKIRLGASSSNNPSDSDILALSVQQFATSSAYSGSLTFANEYLVVYIPASFGIPAFKINGLNNNAFTKVRDNEAFVNAYGVAETGDVYVSNTVLTGTLSLQIV